VYIYGSYRKIKTGVPLFWTTLYSNLISQQQIKNSLKTFLDTDRDLDDYQNVIDCSLDHAAPHQKVHTKILLKNSWIRIATTIECNCFLGHAPTPPKIIEIRSQLFTWRQHSSVMQALY